MKRRLILSFCILFSLAVTGSFAEMSAIWNGFETGNSESYSQTGSGTPAISGVTIATSTDVAHSGVVSLKVETFTLPSVSTTTSLERIRHLQIPIREPQRWRPE